MLPVSSRSPVQTTAAYTDLNSLQKIKAEGDKDVALHKVAKQFESMFVSLLFKGMRQANAVFEEGNMGHSNAENMYRDMHDQQMSLNISEGRGMGIADMVYRQLKGNIQPEKVNLQGLDHSQMYKNRSLSPSNNAQLQAALNTADKSVTETVPVKTKTMEKQLDFLPKTPQEFTQGLLPVAKKVAKSLGLDPLMMVAQAALETGWGKHMVKDAYGKNSNNLFNIKADSRWQGDSVKTQTIEYRDGIAVKESARFRRYDSIANSVQDFVGFLQANPRYGDALKNASDGHQFVEALQQAGYATDPQYANKIKAVYQKVQSLIDAEQKPASDNNTASTTGWKS